MNGKMKRALVVPSAIVMFGALAFSWSCGGEDDDGDTGGTTGGTASGMEGGTEGGTGGAGGTTFTGKVVNSIQVGETISGVKARFFNVDTGAFLPGEWTSGSDGRFTAQRPENAGVFVLGTGMWSDGWNHPPARKGEEDLVRMSSAGSADVVPMLAQYTNDPEAAPLAGNVLWHNAATGQDEFVGCAIVEGDGAKDVRYFAPGGNLPTSLTNRSATEGTIPPDGTGGNDASAGKFFIANLAAGLQTIRASIDGTMIATRTVFITPRKEGSQVNTTPPQKSNVHFASLVVEGHTTNPTPAGCQ